MLYKQILAKISSYYHKIVLPADVDKRIVNHTSSSYAADSISWLLSDNMVYAKQLFYNPDENTLKIDFIRDNKIEHTLSFDFGPDIWTEYLIVKFNVIPVYTIDENTGIITILVIELDNDTIYYHLYAQDKIPASSIPCISHIAMESCVKQFDYMLYTLETTKDILKALEYVRFEVQYDTGFADLRYRLPSEVNLSKDYSQQYHIDRFVENIKSCTWRDKIWLLGLDDYAQGIYTWDDEMSKFKVDTERVRAILNKMIKGLNKLLGFKLPEQTESQLSDFDLRNDSYVYGA